MILKSIRSKKVFKLIKNGGVGVLPTDTIYGVCGSALDENIVERIYRIKKRDKKKPMVINIGSYKQLDLLGIKLDKDTKDTLNRLWPGKVSAILSCKLDKFSYLHRGKNSLAVRFPDFKELTDLLKKVGPVVSTSANIEGTSPANNIEEAQDYFGDKVDFYVDGGRLEAIPSTLIDIKEGKINVLRQGETKVD